MKKAENLKDYFHIIKKTLKKEEKENPQEDKTVKQKESE